VRVFAPGKLVLTGAYAVLEGAPSIVAAVSRGAFADASRAALDPTPEVRAALDADGAHEDVGDLVAPHPDASDMFLGARKLGLGASAAILVASIGAIDAAAGTDLADPSYRARLFTRARDAHSAAQGGGSGVDVAASVFGGVSRYVMGALPVRAALPAGLVVTVFACGTSARTSELRGEIDRLARRDPATHRARLEELGAIARRGAAAVDAGDASTFVEALRETARSLAQLGHAADVALVPAGFAELEALAAREEASFSVSGAGGGDVAVFVGRSRPSAVWTACAKALGLFPLDLTLDTKGVRLAPFAAAGATGPEASPEHPSRQT
jgi:phosphomevalonate kinase